MSDKLAVTIPEATRIIGVGRTTLYRLFEQGKLTPRKVGKRTLILMEELEAFIQSLPKAG